MNQVTDSYVTLVIQEGSIQNLQVYSAKNEFDCTERNIVLSSMFFHIIVSDI